MRSSLGSCAHIHPRAERGRLRGGAPCTRHTRATGLRGTPGLSFSLHFPLGAASRLARAVGLPAGGSKPPAALGVTRWEWDPVGTVVSHGSGPHRSRGAFQHGRILPPWQPASRQRVPGVALALHRGWRWGRGSPSGCLPWRRAERSRVTGLRAAPAAGRDWLTWRSTRAVASLGAESWRRFGPVAASVTVPARRGAGAGAVFHWGEVFVRGEGAVSY